MNIIEQLTQDFQKTFEDKNLSKSERNALRINLAEANLDQRKRDILRSKIFDIAKTGIMGGESVFTLDWLEDATRLLEAKAGGNGSSSSVYFSPGEACLNAIISQIRGARQQLDICVFTISDDRITDAILERFSRGVNVRIVSDNDKANDKGSDIYELARKGVPVRIDNTRYHMHHKFAVIDGNAAITGSYNWTRSAATSNEENILVTEEDVVVERYKKEFKELWGKFDPI